MTWVCDLCLRSPIAVLLLFASTHHIRPSLQWDYQGLISHAMDEKMQCCVHGQINVPTQICVQRKCWRGVYNAVVAPMPGGRGWLKTWKIRSGSWPALCGRWGGESRPYRSPWEAPLARQGEQSRLRLRFTSLCQWHPAPGLGNWLAAVCKCMCLAGSLQFPLSRRCRGANREAGACHPRLPELPSSNMTGNFSDNIQHEHSRLSLFFF